MFDKYTADILINSEAYFCQASKLDDQFESAISISKKIINNDFDGYMKDFLPIILEKVIPLSSKKIKETDINNYFKNWKLDVKKFKNLVIKNDANIKKSKLDKLINFINNFQNIKKNRAMCNALKKIINIKNEIGVFSMTTRANNQPMWAWYANMYEGYVIEYDIDEYLNKNEEMKKELSYVNYSNERKNNPINILLNIFYDSLYRTLNIQHDKSDVIKDIKSIINTKSIDWRFQDEWRFFGKPETKVYIPIKAIYIGVNVSETNKDLIIKIAKEKGYKVYQQLNNYESTNIEFEQVI